MKSNNWKRTIIGRPAQYSHYLKTRKQKIKIDFATYRKILDLFHKGIVKAIVEDGFQWSLPKYFGLLFVIGRVLNQVPGETRVLNVDWKTTMQYWEDDPEAKKEKKLVPYDNWHTDGTVFRAWWRRTYNTRQVKIIKFQPAHSFKQSLFKIIKSGRFNQFERY